LVDLTNNKNKIYENPKAGIMKQQSKPQQKNEKDESRKWKLRKGNILVVEDAKTASLVIVARGLKDLSEKITVLKEVLAKFETQLVQP
jgi:hypothetical protein